MKIAIFGANGPTGRLVTRRVLEAGHSAVAVTRRPREFPLDHPALTVAGADVREAALGDVVTGADAVISTLGVPFTRRPVDTYSIGISHIVAAMRRIGVRRLAVVSSTGAYHYPGRRKTPFTLRMTEPVIARTIGRTVYDDVRRMESIVRDSGLDWTIVRPSGLFDLSERTNYIAGEVDPVGAFTARVDLADYLLALVSDSTAIAKTVIVSTTEGTPTMWQMIRREAFKTDQPKNAAASS
jgi:putative NADH-flavin reductase